MPELFRNFRVLGARPGDEIELARLIRPAGWGEPGSALSDGDNEKPLAAILAGTAAAERRTVGEIIFDSTADWRANTRSFLAFHLDGRLLTRRPELYLPDAFCSVEGGEAPYLSLLWQRLGATPDKRAT